MPAENPLVHCLDRLNLGDDQRLLQRAEYYQGLCSSRIPVKVFDKGPNCKAVVAIQLAAESLLLGNDWDTKLAAQLAGCTKRGYESTLSNVRKSLNLQPNVSLDTLGVAFGCTTMVPLVKTLWEEFAPAYLARLRGAQRQIAKEELEQQPAWKGAVFYACAKALGERLAKAKVQTMCACTAAEMTRYLKAVEEVSSKSISELKKNDKTRRTGRRRQKSGDPEEGEDASAKEAAEPAKKRARSASSSKPGEPIPNEASGPSSQPQEAKETTMPKSGVASMISHQDYRDTRRYHDYLAWHAELHARLKAA